MYSLQIIANTDDWPYERHILLLVWFVECFDSYKLVYDTGSKDMGFAHHFSVVPCCHP